VKVRLSKLINSQDLLLVLRDLKDSYRSLQWVHL